jgi:hypothetical protein
VPQNVRENLVLNDPKTLAERKRVARDFATQFKVNIPILVDPMDDPFNTAFAAWPDRIYVLDAAGKVAYKGGPGPGGFRVAEVPPVLRRLLGEGQ